MNAETSSLGHFLSGIKSDFSLSTRSEDEIEILKDLPVETAFLALKQCDAESALWFYKNASPEQIQGLIDLDVWESDEFQVDRFANHFKMMSLTSAEKLGEYMKELDPELIVLSLMKWCTVVDFDHQNPPEVEESKFLLTLDSKYALLLKSENPEIRELLYLWINKFSTVDMDLLRRHLESCKWEQETDLEEHAFQFKKGRLEELGFVDYFEAISLYARGTALDEKQKLLATPLEVDAKFHSVKNIQEDSELDAQASLFPDVIVNPFQSEGLLAEALKEIKDPTKKHILMMELIRCINASLVADKLLFEELPKISLASQRARRYLDLGLIYLSDGNKARATELLLVQPFMKIYHLGWLSVAELSQAAKAILLNFGPGLFDEKDLELLNTFANNRHPDLSAAMIKELGLQIQSSTLLHPQALLQCGAYLKNLAEFAKTFLSLLGTPLAIKERPLGVGENIVSRLCNALFRQASGYSTDGELNVAPLTGPEFLELQGNFKADVAQKLSLAIAGRFPEALQKMFSKRIHSQLSDIEHFIRSNPSPKTPDPRFFKALYFSL